MSVERAVAFECNSADKLVRSMPVEVVRSFIVRSIVHWTSICDVGSLGLGMASA